MADHRAGEPHGTGQGMKRLPTAAARTGLDDDRKEPSSALSHTGGPGGGARPQGWPTHKNNQIFHEPRFSEWGFARTGRTAYISRAVKAAAGPHPEDIVEGIDMIQPATRERDARNRLQPRAEAIRCRRKRRVGTPPWLRHRQSGTRGSAPWSIDLRREARAEAAILHAANTNDDLR